MKVGFILECGPIGADYKVIEHLLRRLRKDVEPLFRFGNSKGTLFRECGEMVRLLFDEKRCVRVFVVWDLVPPEFITQDDKPCRAKERAHVRNKLRPEDRARTVLLCITHELEAWLLADGSAVTAELNRQRGPEHQMKRAVPDERHPERHPNPKKVLAQHFKENGTRDYDDKVHALKIIKAVDNLAKLDRAPSFKRLREKLEAL